MQYDSLLCFDGRPRGVHRVNSPRPRPVAGLLLLLVATHGCGGGERSLEQPIDIVLISIDGFRYDRAHFAGNPQETTPNLDRFVEDSLLFELSFSQSNESLLSHSALFTGRYPSEIARPDYFEFLLPEVETTLAEMLSAVGYTTGAFVAGGHVRSEFGIQQGFEFYRESPDFGSMQITADMAADWILDVPPDEPLFAFVHGYDLHRPYAHASVFYHPFGGDYVGPMENIVNQRNDTERIYQGVFYPEHVRRKHYHEAGIRMSDPLNYRRLSEEADNQTLEGTPLSEEDIEHMRYHYDTGVLASDYYVGHLLEVLRASPRWQNTLVLVVSDHGEDLQTHGFSNHRAVVQDSTTRVPFVIGGGALPEAWRGQRRQEVTSAVDVLPTLAEAVGTVSPAASRGRSLWGLLQGQSLEPGSIFQQGVLGQVSLRNQTHRLVFEGPPLADPAYLEHLTEAISRPGRLKLYHSAEDPDELTNLAQEEPVLLEALHGELVAWLATLPRSETRQAPSREAREVMQSRGYWSSEEENAPSSPETAP